MCTCRSHGERAASDCQSTAFCLCARADHEGSEQPVTVSVLLFICVHMQITRGARSHYLAPYYSACLYARAERASIVSVLLFCVSTHAVSGGERAANDCHCTIPRLCARVGHEESEQPVTVTVLYFFCLHVQVTRRADSAARPWRPRTA